MEHKGTFEELQMMVKTVGRKINQSSKFNLGQQIKTSDGAVINWYESTGKVQFQGKETAKQKLEQDLRQYMEESFIQHAPSTAASTSVSCASKVFIVHGHDTTAREQLELVIHKLGLDPYVLQNNSGDGLTIIEALENEIGTRAGSAKFGIVLLTPDDMGYAKSAGEKEVQPRARQNVVLEMGMLISALGRQNVAILKKQHLEIPSDAQGILYISFNEHVKEAVPKLVDRLCTAGFKLTLEAITRASG